MGLMSGMYCESCDGLGCASCGGDGWSAKGKAYDSTPPKPRNPGVLNYEDDWGKGSEGWPSVPYTIAKYLLCTKANVVPYGSYVVMGTKSLGGGRYDYSEAVIRCATQALADKLETAYQEMFVVCGSSLCADPAVVDWSAKLVADAARPSWERRYAR